MKNYRAVLGPNEREHWDEECQKATKSIRSLYVYDPSEVTHLCEIAPSFYLMWVDVSTIRADDREDGTIDIIEQCAHGAAEDVYMHVSDVLKLPNEDLGEYDDIDEAIEEIRANQCNLLIYEDPHVMSFT
jgi:SepF-like predicted cell division protein (DUF552 family)